MFNDPKPDDIADWICIYETGTEYVAELVRSYFLDQGIEAQILSKKDSSYVLSVGNLSMVYVYVPATREKEARKALDDWKNGLLDINDEPDSGE